MSHATGSYERKTGILWLFAPSCYLPSGLKSFLFWGCCLLLLLLGSGHGDPFFYLKVPSSWYLGPYRLPPSLTLLRHCHLLLHLLPFFLFSKNNSKAQFSFHYCVCKLFVYMWGNQFLSWGRNLCIRVWVWWANTEDGLCTVSPVCTFLGVNWLGDSQHRGTSLGLLSLNRSQREISEDNFSCWWLLRQTWKVWLRSTCPRLCPCGLLVSFY